MSRCVGLSLVLVVLLGGCGTSTPGGGGPSKGAGSPDLPAGIEVTLLGRERDFAQVQLPEGGSGFVRLSRLVILESGGPGKYLVVEPGPIYTEIPPLHDDPIEPPRPRGEIIADQMSLPAGFMAADRSKLVLLPENKMSPFRDDETGMWMWPAFVCYAPNCPGRKAEGKPYIFPHVDSAIEIRDGKARYNGPPASGDAARATVGSGVLAGPTCPECLKIRNLATETPLEAERYRKLVRRYIPQESVARQLKLAEEYQRLIQSQPRQ